MTGKTAFLGLVLAFLFALPPAVSYAASSSTTVRFASGGDSASYAGRIRGDDTARFIIDARRGQVMDVTLDADNPQAYFNIVLPGSGQAMFNGSVSGNSFQGTLPQSGKFVVEVYLMRAAARRGETSNFRLAIAIPAGGPTESPGGDYADGDAGGPDYWVVSGVASNDRLNVRSNPSPAAEIVGSLRNGAVVRNLGCRTGNGTRWCRISARGNGGVHGWTNGRFLVESGDLGHAPDVTDDGEIRDTKCQESSRECLRRAEQKCNGRYRVIHSESHAGGLLDDKLPGPVTWYYLEYQCGRPDGRVATFPFRGQRYEPDDGGDSGDDGGNSAEREMKRQCHRQAATAFRQRPRDVLILPPERVSDGYLVYGQFPASGYDVTTFTCKFNDAGTFRRVTLN